jgi:hypothetical protein
MHPIEKMATPPFGTDYRRATVRLGTVAAWEGALAVDPEALAGELRFLRKGRGVRHPSVLKRIGPQVRTLCGIEEPDTAATARTKVHARLTGLLRTEPDEVQLAVSVALALHPEAGQRTLADREFWLAQRQHYEQRTARRRIDDAFEVLVQAAARAEDTREDSVHAAPDGWWVQSLEALLRLDIVGPELTERRRVIFAQNNVERIACLFSVPKPCRAPAAPEVSVEVLYGGQIGARERPSAQHFRYLINLPRRFRKGEIHEYGMVFRFPPDRPMAPHYVLLPLTACESFDLTVRFHPNQVPPAVWQLNGVPPRMIDDDEPVGAMLRPDRFGELRLAFRDLRQGRAYGVKWASSR